MWGLSYIEQRSGQRERTSGGRQGPGAGWELGGQVHICILHGTLQCCAQKQGLSKTGEVSRSAEDSYFLFSGSDRICLPQLERS